MGTFVNFYGDMTVAPEKLPELTERMARLWEQGGMMQVEEINLFGKHISLLHQPEPDERADGWIWTCYNYHENDFWETFSYGPASGRLCSSKLGQLNFCRSVLASYILLEFYVEGFALTALDGDMINGEPFIGWLNYIFDEQYTNQRESGLWAAPILKAGTPVSKEILSSPWSVVEPLPTEKFIHRTGNARAYLWTPDGDVEISPAMWLWLAELRRKLDAHLDREGELFPPQKLVERLVYALDTIQRKGRYVFAFRDMFYEFLARSTERPIQAAVLLLEDLAAAEIDNHKATLEGRRLMAVLFNRALRQEVLGF